MIDTVAMSTSYRGGAGTSEAGQRALFERRMAAAVSPRGQQGQPTELIAETARWVVQNGADSLHCVLVR